MVDNVDLNAGSGGDTIAADDIAGVKYQRVKVAHGADGSATDVSSAAPLPVTLADTGANATAVKVDGSAVTQPVSAASLPLPTGAATGAKQDTGNTALAAIQTAAELIDDAVGAPDASAPTKGMQIMLNQSGTARVWGGVSVTGLSGAAGAVTGARAHDAADAGNPVKIGAKAETALSGITLVADGDVTDLHAGVDGVLITRPHANLEDIVTGNASNTDGSSTQVIAASGVGVKTYLLGFTLTNTSATDTYCEIKDGTTAKWTVPVPANGGVTVNLPVPIPGTANTAWNFDMGAGVTTAYCSMIGFKSKV